MVGSVADGVEHRPGLDHVGDGPGHGRDELRVGQVGHGVDNPVLARRRRRRRGWIVGRRGRLLDVHVDEVGAGGGMPGHELGQSVHDVGEDGEGFRVRIHPGGVRWSHDSASERESVCDGIDDWWRVLTVTAVSEVAAAEAEYERSKIKKLKKKRAEWMMMITKTTIDDQSPRGTRQWGPTSTCSLEDSAALYF